jgi:site-specific DNA-methyltransferase (adenine-specific)
VRWLVSQGDAERLGYPTQKPLGLMERVINSSCPEGGSVLDPFCGCGTSIAAAETLGRHWLGIDITHLAIALQKYRLCDMFPNVQFKVVGEPKDLGAAYQLAKDDRYQFQWWALSLIRAKPLGGKPGGKAGKKGSDRGIDGVVNFVENARTGKTSQILVQVKSGENITSGDIRDLNGTIQREKNAVGGVFITLKDPTSHMTREAASTGLYKWGETTFPRIQILTVNELLHGAEVKMPPQYGTFKEAPQVQMQGAESPQLELG